MRLLTVLVLAALLAACSAGPAPEPRAGAKAPVASSPAATVDPEAPSGWGPTQGELARAGRLVAAMSPEERVSQVLMPGFFGHVADRPSAAEAARNRDSHGVDTAAQAVARHGYGGVFVRPETITDARQVRSLVDALHAQGDRPDGLPLLVSVDQEGGDVQRIRDGVTRWPSARRVGRTGDAKVARAVARGNGTELRAMGFTMALAPVADVDTARNAIVASRAYSSDHAADARLVVASVRGYLDAGIVPVVKHFPGHGSVHGDSHHDLPVQSKTVSRLERTDLVPFAAAIRAGVPAVMSAHVAVTALEPGIPASLSRPVVTGLLRERLGFQGVVITDSQGMGPVYGTYGNAESAVRSLLAGNDLVLNSPDATKARRGVLRAVASGRLPESRLTEAATRVVALRVYQQRIGARRPPMSVLRSAEHRAVAARAGG
ncbi:MAG: beta-N-acetylhexosaminidase [Actinomycetota bacterium]|jgi:beta-N-acetylhexosaminidase|nr:beta-N-acetylhexosaminidase [Actinomycetota bacterium]